MNTFRYLFLMFIMFAHATRPMEKSQLNYDLHKAAEKGELQKVKSLIADGADVNYAEGNGLTALMLAALKGHNEVVQALIEAKARITVADKGGYNAFMWAVDHWRINPEELHAWDRKISSHEKCGQLLINCMMRMPNDDQKKNIYTFLICMKKKGCKDLCIVCKPYLLDAVEAENSKKPKKSVAHQEIQKIKDKVKKAYWSNYLETFRFDCADFGLRNVGNENN